MMPSTQRCLERDIALSARNIENVTPTVRGGSMRKNCRRVGVIAGCMMVPIVSAARSDGLGDELDRLWLDRHPVPRANCLHFLMKA
jgi:hypothetical protein